MTSSKTARWPCLVAFIASAIVGQGCASTVDASSTDEDAVSTNLLGSKKELFDQEMLFVRITGWSGNPEVLNQQRDEARLGDAEISIYKTDARSSEHCPSSGNQLVYRTKAFTLATSGNLTNGTPKSSYKLSLEDKNDKLFGMKKVICSSSSAHRRFLEWTEAGVFEHAWLKALEAYDEFIGIDWSWQSMDGAMTKAPLGGEKNGAQSDRPRQAGHQAQPTDRRDRHTAWSRGRRRQSGRLQDGTRDAREHSRRSP